MSYSNSNLSNRNNSNNRNNYCQDPNKCGQLGVCENTNPCSPNPNCDFRINQMTNLIYDPCYNVCQEGVGNYHMSNYVSCECGAPDQKEIALDNPTMTFRDGFGWVGLDGCLVDIDSFFRVGKLLPKSYKSCNPANINTYNNNFIPMLSNLADEIQRPEHIVQEAVCSDWVRGGIPSRQLNKTVAYLEHCNQYIHNISRTKLGKPLAVPQYYKDYQGRCS